MYPNVLAAEGIAERQALKMRYDTAKRDAKQRRVGQQLRAFERAVGHSKVVIARSEDELQRLASSTRQLYSSYYQLVAGRVKLPDGDEFEPLRQLADTLLFPGYKDEIRFGALSLDGIGVARYGSCHITLRDSMVSHRASIFEENSALFVEKQQIPISRKSKVPEGYRANWAERGKLCVAKLSHKIDKVTLPNRYNRILLKQGASAELDEFVEVHICGPITVLTMEQVIIKASKPQHATILKSIKFNLAQHNVRTG